MTYYQEQIIKISKEVYSKDYLCKQIVQAKKFIDEHFYNNINLTSIAEKAHISRFHFIRLFKKNYGRTPYQYLTEVRIRKAKEFLRSGKAIADVCASVGFESITSFTGLFKKITGSTPSAFQNKRKIEKKQF
jgi:AraC-like DNA-binding protein